MDNSSIDLSLANIWQNWFRFKKGKRKTKELDHFNYYIEQNLHTLYLDLNTSKYRHGAYKTFTVSDNKRREIRVAEIKDRVVHRLLYEYLLKIYDKSFIYDAWSCRKKKGLLGAIERTQKFLIKHPNSFVWRADIEKFFDNVDQQTLLKIISLRIKDTRAANILKKIIASYSASARTIMQDNEYARAKGIPIGNLTSQIFANIYLNELDRFIKHSISPQAYLRYGDDFVVISKKLEKLNQIRAEIINFLKEKLLLEINSKSDIIIKPKWGLKFLGVVIFSKGRRLNKRNWRRAKAKLNHKNISGYCGLVKQHSKRKRITEFNWIILEKLNQAIQNGRKIV